MTSGTNAPTLTGFDTETHLISAAEIVPRLVCATFDAAAWEVGTGDGDAWIIPNADPLLVDELANMFRMTLKRKARIIIQFAAFDLTVVLRYAHEVQRGYQIGNKSVAEELYQLVWEVLDQGLEDELRGGQSCVHDTSIREKLYALSTHGSLESYRGQELRFDLASLVRNHFNVDISDAKVSTDAAGRIFDADGNDITGSPKAAAAWRLRYCELDGVPLSQWPVEAASYAISDATWARKVFMSQERVRVPRGFGSMNSESLQVYADTALKLYSMPGFPIDREQVARVNAAVDAVMSKVEVTLQLNGVVRSNYSVNTAVVAERIKAAWATIGRTPMLTPGGDVSAAGEVLETLDGIDPILDLYAERQELSKIRSAFLPSLEGDRVWTNYDILKETGRISAYGSSEKARRKPLYPAVNITQIPRKHGVRECFLAPVGDYAVTLGKGAASFNGAPPPWVQVSCDYAALELCSVAQVTYSLFGYSVHRDKINAGYDLHSYLGGAMARSLAPAVVDYHSNLDEGYKALRAYLKAKLPPDQDTSQEAEHVRFMRKEAGTWRNFSKPTGLGFPGGLGPETHVSFAKATYGVKETVDQARMFRELWLTTYPEMTDFFRWVNQQKDMQRPQDDDYCYETQGYNRMRAGTTYCATANGKSMQSLSADGAKRSTCWLARTCYGGTPGQPWQLLHGLLPSAFIHDENLVALPLDELTTERCLMISQLMINALAVSMPDVKLGCEPAVMRRWTKRAEPEWVDDPGRESRVEQALIRWYGGVPPNAWLDEFFKALGPTYNPNRRLIPWDDAHEWRET